MLKSEGSEALPLWRNAMSFNPRYFAPLLVAAGAIASIAVAPIAAADGADATIADLEGQGYTVQINWVNGFDTEPLSVCTVTGINNPDSSPQPKKATTLYVDVACPNHQDD
jgi:hypothetical protein